MNFKEEILYYPLKMFDKKILTNIIQNLLKISK